MTARAGTEEEAANLALAHLRQPPIALLTDNNDRARAVKAVFAAARAASLRRRWWNFATGWRTLAALAGVTHPSDLKTVYQLPDDCLEVRYVQNADDSAWAVEIYKGDALGADTEVAVLVSNVTAPLVCYTRDVEAVRLWDADFTMCFSYDLAALAGPQLGASASRVEKLRSLADAWNEEASGVDAREKSTERVTRSTSWITARRIGGGRSRP